LCINSFFWTANSNGHFLLCVLSPANERAYSPLRGFKTFSSLLSRDPLRLFSLSPLSSALLQFSLDMDGPNTEETPSSSATPKRSFIPPDQFLHSARLPSFWKAGAFLSSYRHGPSTTALHQQSGFLGRPPFWRVPSSVLSLFFLPMMKS